MVEAAEAEERVQISDVDNITTSEELDGLL